MAAGGARTLRGLALACHPLPTLAVTAISAGLAALAGLDFATGAVLVLAVFTGQLSIGWSNDRIDAARDRAVARSDKPLAAGDVAPVAVTVAIGCALIATVVFSLLLGLEPGLVALLTVAGGWAYNLGLKATVWSWVPFAVSFGLLPAIATLSRSGDRAGHNWPAGWAVIAGALLGVSAHFANVLPDLGDDAATGVRGLPHRLGRRGPVVVGPLLLIGSTLAIVGAGARNLGAARWVALGLAAVVAATAIAAGLRRPSSRIFFVATVLVAAADLALFGLSGGRLR
jgi:4-hydroxybenzoate polyprenyltransferase